MPVVTCWPSYARTVRSSAASTSPSTKRPRPESSIRRPQTSRASRSRGGRSSAFKRPTREKSSSSAAECPSFWTEPSSVRSEQVPAPLNKTSRWQKRLSPHSTIHYVERKGYMARTQESGKAPILEEIPIPDIQPDEILVNVKACGMCRSDVLLIDGFFRPYADVPPPITLGHEVTGVVSKIGSNVQKRRGSTRVIMWSSTQGGVTARVAIAKLATRTFARTCVGPDSDQREALQSSFPSPPAI